MILATGIDAVEIDRFKNWHNYPKNKLLKVFSHEEIEYCLKIPTKSPERFAARFAAKEAFYKSLSSFNNIKISFLGLCKIIHVLKKENGSPFIEYNYKNYISNELTELIDSLDIKLSITHTKKLAIACVIITK